MATHPGPRAELTDPEKSGAGAAAILRSATRLFADRGYDAVPLSAIAEAAGVSKGNIFHHFGSKELLYVAVIREACSHTARLLTELTTSSGSFAERVRHFALAHLRNLITHEEVSRLILREFLEGDGRRDRALVAQVLGENFSKLVGILRAGQMKGEVRQDLDADALALALVAGNVFFFQVRSLLPHLSNARFVEDPDHYSAAVVDVFLKGVLTEPSRRTGGLSDAQIS